MDIDVAGVIGAVDRKLLSRDRDGRQARVVVASRTYRADAEDVWDALTNEQRISRWFMPISGDLRRGGRYQLEGNAGGEITTCEPPRHLAVTWEYGGEVSWVKVWLASDGNGDVRLDLEHESFVADDWWRQYGPGAVGVGWELSLLGLGEHLNGWVKPETDEWSTSENAKAFMRASSERWGEASIAAGTPDSEAREAARRTTAFYLGEPE